MKTKLSRTRILNALSLLLIGGLMLTGAACSKDGDFKETEAPPAPAARQQQQAQAPANAPSASQPAGYHGKVLETMDAGGYTYVHVDTGKEKVWAAAPQFKVAVGDEASFAAEMPMTNFSSNTLDRTFDVVYFVSRVALGNAAAAEATPHDHPAATEAMPNDHPKAPQAQQSPGAPKVADAGVSGIAKAPGGFSVAEIFAGKGALAGSEVSVRGKVVKYNSGIMGLNWLHIQDGTGRAGSNDLTVTTNSSVKVGDTVLVTGTMAVDKDFGAGYRYAVIVEQARVTVE